MQKAVIKNLNNEEIVINDAAIQLLKSRLRGDIILPGDTDYDKERSIWNGMINKKPGMIICCKGGSDVIHSINFARENNLLISVRGGGHNVAGNAVCEGGLMISLIYMKGIIVDPVNRTATAQPGVNWGELDKETQVFGLAAPGGVVSTTGISGLTLGGGFGWISRQFGFTSDNLISADIVTADGKFMTASKNENSDLFWGICGGGGNFGIVTSFKYKLHKVGPNVVAGLTLYPVKDAPDVIKFFNEFSKSAPDELTLLLVLRLAPPAPFVPVEFHGKPVVGIGLLYNGDIEEGKKVVEPIKSFGKPVVDVITVKPYMVHQSMFDAGQASGKYYYWKSEYLPEINDDCAKVIIENLDKITSPLTGILIFQLKGEINRIDENSSAAEYRDAVFIMNINTCWEKPEESEKHIKWTKDFWNSMLAFSSGGVYVNFISQDEGEERAKAAYKANYKKLAQLKNKYDPSNFFRINQNIKPGA
jgi:FAD/FMN-containing dehydrogenase